MAKTNSKTPPKSTRCPKIKSKLQSLRQKLRNPSNPHRSFRRSYREDYRRNTHTPGLLAHAVLTFQTIFGHWRTFLPLIMLFVALDVIFVGLMSEELYQQFQTAIDDTSAELGKGDLSNFAKAGILLISTITSGGLDTGMGDTQTILMILIFLALWLVTIFLLRHFAAGSKPRMRDGLYNALAPLISTLMIFIVVFVQMIPLMLVVITYSAAVATGFLSTPFYALVYFIFAALMILISTYLVSSSLIALVAVTAPGVYPLTALTSSAELVAGRRSRIVLRVLYLIVIIAVIYLVTMLPVILLDLWLKSLWSWLEGWPIVPFFLLVVTCFVFVYASAYLYQYYRWLLEDDSSTDADATSKQDDRTVPDVASQKSSPVSKTPSATPKKSRRASRRTIRKSSRKK